MTQKEKNAFGIILNLSYESESRVALANGGGIRILGDIIKSFVSHLHSTVAVVDISHVALNCFCRMCKVGR